MNLLTLNFSAVKVTRAHSLAIRNLPTGSLTNHEFSSRTYLRKLIYFRSFCLKVDSKTITCYLPSWSVDLKNTRNRTWRWLIRGTAGGEAVFRLTSLLNGTERIYSRGATWRQHAPQSNHPRDDTNNARFSGQFGSLATWSDHGENQRQKNHNCAPAHQAIIEIIFLLFFFVLGRGMYTYNGCVKKPASQA